MAPPRSLLSIPRPACAPLVPALMALVLLGLTGCDGSGDHPGPPNVVLITLDTTRPDYLSCYSEARVGTDALQRIADEGVRFDAALSASGVTPVSHATILTGSFPYEHGLRVLSGDSGFRLPEDQPTIVSTLHAKGYRTAAILSAFPVSGYFGFDRDFDVFEAVEGEMTLNEELGKTVWDGLSLQRRSDETAQLVLKFLEQQAGEDQPFLLWLHLWDPHDPGIKPPPEWISHIKGEGSYAAASEVYAQMYAAEVRFMDSQIGVVMDGLREHGMDSTTLIAVTADHGEGLRDGHANHGWSKHRMNYQEQIHVPLLLHGPGVPAGVVVTDMVRTADITPTLLDYAGFGEDFAGGAGRSLRPLMEGGQLPVAMAYADQINGYDANASMTRPRPDSAFLYTVCDGEWKLIFRPHMIEATELFNLVQDPSEQRNLMATHPEQYLRLMDDLAARAPWVLEPFPKGDFLDPEMSAALDASGYTGGSGGSAGEWWWFCPAHPDYRRETREGPGATKRHGVDGCEQAVVPRTTWIPKEH
jgi:arylsulfatase A-like enzyme